ncbi:GDP-L-fucose synthase [Hyphomonas sp.]|uniref:GDP-L-fucose synthase n=1 Tax=Hyphomonas sp. TaxID=87 RepID=UPI003D2970C9|tara:strand:+ start:9967 stop:10923 length:957 start_codon:yes stop_codon:yes gene_type:complete
MTDFNLKDCRIFVAGHRGMVGAAMVRRLEQENCEVITAGRDELNLLDQTGVRAWFADRKPDAVVLAAAKVGGIVANDTYPADFLYENLVIETNVIEAAFRAEVSKLLFLGSSCIYPKLAPQPITEDALLTGPLEPTNEWYAIAKIAGLKLCGAYRRQYGVDYISGMPTNLYGPGDNFHLENSHVIPALMRKAHDAKHAGARTMEIWGTGSPRREFLHVDDCADALVFLLKNYSGEQHVNVGSGTDLTIADLARKVMAAVEFDGELTFDTSRPDGTPRKLMSGDKIASLGWSPRIDLDAGLQSTYDWFLDHASESDFRA